MNNNNNSNHNDMVVERSSRRAFMAWGSASNVCVARRTFWTLGGEHAGRHHLHGIITALLGCAAWQAGLTHTSQDIQSPAHWLILTKVTQPVITKQNKQKANVLFLRGIFFSSGLNCLKLLDWGCIETEVPPGGPTAFRKN